MTDPLDAWFKTEILAHEEVLMRFLRLLWKRDPSEIHDLRQEIYMRVYEAAARSRPTQPRSFLLTTAKHLVTDRIRRQRIVTIDTVADLEALDVMVNEISPERQTMARQELRTLARAFDSLPPKCRETVWFRRVERLSTREVAARLGITQKTVEGHLTKGLKRLADALFANDTGEAEAPRKTSKERIHG
jgi:RNA polymerase sigma factor (sigma-70 family)